MPDCRKSSQQTQKDFRYCVNGIIQYNGTRKGERTVLYMTVLFSKDDNRNGIVRDHMDEKQNGKRLNQYIASCGVCSRREADRYVEDGRVTVNDAPAQTGMRIREGDQVCVDGERIQPDQEKVVLAYYKPCGVVCTERDTHAEQTIIEALHYPIRVTYAGRLDQDSDGLMIMTNDGMLINAMMKGANLHEKEYLVQVDRTVTHPFMERMAAGVWLEELEVRTRPCKVIPVGKDTFRIILTQGLNRQIRRMCQENGYEVINLTRTRIMNIRLDGLSVGEYRKIEGQELAQLYRDCQMEAEGNRINGNK